MTYNFNHSVITEDIQNEDAVAFQKIYHRQCDVLYSYFKRKTTTDDALDLMQTTFLKLWQYRASLSQTYPVEQQLFYIARTVFIDYLRKENKRAHLQQQIRIQAENNTYLPPALSHSLSSQLASLLAVMPELRRKVFQLIRLQGYSYKEAAQLLSISVKAVDNHLSKAIKQLRNGIVMSLLLVFVFA